MLSVEYKATGELIPYVNNSRTHSEEQVQQVAASIKEFGFTNPILIDDEGGIIAGHGRLLAAQLCGIAEVPTITLEGLTEAQRKAYVIADNKLALNAGWDYEALKLEIETISSDFDITKLGFDDNELANLIDGLEQDAVELKEDSYSSVYNIVVNCTDENHQERVFNELQQKGYECQVQSL